MKLRKICNFLNEIAPLEDALSFDNVGLLVGDYDSDIRKILVALDVTSEVVEEAILLSADLIISHHPFIFNPIKNVTSDTVTGNLLIKCIKNDIAVYSSHTNLDKAMCGTNMLLASKISLKNKYFLDDPSHICVIGDLNTTVDEIINTIKTNLFIDYVRFIGDNKKTISKVAVSTGSGDSYSLFKVLKDNFVDILITGDLTYHKMQYAKEIGLNVIDATHFYSENIVVEHLKEILENELPETTVITSIVTKNIFETI